MIYLIDFENISVSGLTGLESLNSDDRILLFYSEMANKISIDLHLELERSPAKREYFCVKTGSKNALDFQLATHLGYLIASEPDQSYAIVTKDEGFNALVHFWEERDVAVQRCVNLSVLGAPKKAAKAQKVEKPAKPVKPVKAKAPKEKKVTVAPVRPSVDGFTPQELDELSNALSSHPHVVDKTAEIIAEKKTRQPINVALVKAFGADTAFEIYRAIKPLLKIREKAGK